MSLFNKQCKKIYSRPSLNKPKIPLRDLKTIKFGNYFAYTLIFFDKNNQFKF